MLTRPSPYITCRLVCTFVTERGVLDASIPFDSKARDSWLVGQDIPSHLLDYRLGWRLGIQLLAVVLVVDVVTHTHELAAIVAARQQYDGHAQDLGVRDALGVWWVGFEDELVDADRDGAHEEGVKLLVVLVAASR